MQVNDYFTIGQNVRIGTLKKHKDELGTQKFIIPLWSDTTSAQEDMLQDKYDIRANTRYTVAYAARTAITSTNLILVDSPIRVEKGCVSLYANLDVTEWPNLLAKVDPPESKPTPTPTSTMLGDFIHEGDKVQFAILRSKDRSPTVECEHWFVLPGDKPINLSKYALASEKEHRSASEAYATLDRVPGVPISQLAVLNTEVRIRTKNPGLDLSIDLDDWPDIRVALEPVKHKAKAKQNVKPLSHYIPEGLEIDVVTDTKWSWLVAPKGSVLPKGYKLYPDIKQVERITISSTEYTEWFADIYCTVQSTLFVLRVDPELWPEMKADLIAAGVRKPSEVLYSITDYMEDTKEECSGGIGPGKYVTFQTTKEAASKEVPAKKEEEVKMTVFNIEKIFGSKIGKDTSGMFKLSGMGIAVRGDNGSYRCFDQATAQCVDVMEMVIDTDMVYRMPAKEVVSGDLIISNNAPYYVIGSGEVGITVFNPKEEKIETLVPSRSLLGFQFFIKVVSLFNLNGATSPKDGGLQAMLPLMLLGGDEGAAKDPMEMMLMMQMMGGTSGAGGMDMQAMLPLMLMGGLGGDSAKSYKGISGDSSSGNKMMETMLMMQMLGGTAGAVGGGMDMQAMLPLMLMGGGGDSSKMMEMMLMMQMTKPAVPAITAAAKRTTKAKTETPVE